MRARETERSPVEAGDAFYARLPRVSAFASLADPASYAPLPDGWVLGLADIVQSTAAIEAGRYKAVNSAAAAVIAAACNAWPDGDFPFVFGGDGASFAVPASRAPAARDALQAVAAWSRDELALAMRVAAVPVADIRAAGRDVRVARFAPSPDVSYAMFAGGGVAWAEARMKAGAIALPPAPAGTWPDLSGLSCRFDKIAAERGVILSLIVLPVAGADEAAFQALAGEILELVEGSGEAARPVPTAGPPLSLTAGVTLEARTIPPGRLGRSTRTLRAAARGAGGYAVFRAGMRLGRFDPARYRRELVANTDFRKFDDGLRMTLDCTPALADRLDTLLRRARAAGIARGGTHRQEAALMTCFVPSPTRSDHVHFIDGAQGGYAAAAQGLKASG